MNLTIEELYLSVEGKNCLREVVEIAKSRGHQINIAPTSRTNPDEGSYQVTCPICKCKFPPPEYFISGARYTVSAGDRDYLITEVTCLELQIKDMIE